MTMRILSAALLMAATFGATPLLANEPKPTARIDLTGLDLTTPKAVQRAERRIDRAVQTACRNNVEHLSPRASRSARLCREEMRGMAMRKLRAKQLQQLASQ